MNREPARLIYSITAIVTAVIGILAYYGLDLPAEHIIGIIGPTLALVIGGGELTRANVASPAYVEKTQTAYYEAGKGVGEHGYSAALPTPRTIKAEADMASVPAAVQWPRGG